MATASVLEEKAASPSAGEESLFEIVNGERVEIAPMGMYAGTLATYLAAALIQYASPRKLGWAVTEVLFDFGPDKNQRRPDVAFIPQERWLKRESPDPSACKAIPSLAVEVISPSNTAQEIEEKLLEYFDAGVSQVWVIYPALQRIYVYESPTLPRVLTGDEILDVHAILPGLQINLHEFFLALPQD